MTDKPKKKKTDPWDPDYVDPDTGEKVWPEEEEPEEKPKKKKKRRPSDVTDEAEETAEDVKRRNKWLKRFYGEPSPKAQKEGLDEEE